MAAEDANDLRRALESNEIIPYFQPLVELRTGLLRGFEALARWQHPQRGLIQPMSSFLWPKNPAFTACSPANSSPPSSKQPKTSLPPHTLGQHLPHSADRPHSSPTHLRRRRTRKLPPPPSHPRNHRERPRRQHRTRRPHRNRVQGTGLPPRARRLRNRLLQPPPPPTPPLRRTQNRCQLRPLHDAHPREQKDRRCHRRPRQQPQPHHRRRRRRNQTIADMLLWLGCDIGQGWLYGRPVPPEQLPEALAERLNPHQTAIRRDPSRLQPAPRLRSSPHPAPRSTQRNLRRCPRRPLLSRSQPPLRQRE